MVLSLTGLYIANPLPLVGLGFPIMAWSHDLHVLTGWVLIAALVGRIFLMFTGNPWARWDQLFPSRSDRRAQLWHTIRYYLFLEHEPAEVVGHNPMAGLSYLGIYATFILQALTGVLLIGAQDRTNGWMWALTGWTTNLVPLPTLRLIHHLILWGTWVFVIMHLYAATLTDRIERGGEISSIIGGWKILPRERVEQDLQRHADRRRARLLRRTGRRDPS
jgi:Ni/Fe-hydrogenase 1 B-type cytochrome subunit